MDRRVYPVCRTLAFQWVVFTCTEHQIITYTSSVRERWDYDIGLYHVADAQVICLTQASSENIDCCCDRMKGLEADTYDLFRRVKMRVSKRTSDGLAEEAHP